jgi:hypothetical protein
MEGEIRAEEAKEQLLAYAGEEDPVTLPPSVLGSLSASDIPPDTAIKIGTSNDGITTLDFSGRLYCDEGNIKAEADLLWTRKYCYAPLGLEQYLDLVKRAIEVR